MQVDKEVIAVADGIKEYEAEIAELKAALKKTADWAEELSAANLKLISEITALSAEIRSIRHANAFNLHAQQYAQMQQFAQAQQNALAQQQFANPINQLANVGSELPDRPSEEDPNVCTCVPSRHGFFRRWL